MMRRLTWTHVDTTSAIVAMIVAFSAVRADQSSALPRSEVAAQVAANDAAELPIVTELKANVAGAKSQCDALQRQLREDFLSSKAARQELEAARSRHATWHEIDAIHARVAVTMATVTASGERMTAGCRNYIQAVRAEGMRLSELTMRK